MSIEARKKMLMSKTKSGNKNSKQQRDIRRLQKTATDIVVELFENAFDEHVLISIHEETTTTEGVEFTLVASSCVYEKGGTYYNVDTSDGINTMADKPFVRLLATKLAAKGLKRHKVSAIYFDVDPEAERLAIPSYEVSFQWEIVNGTIVPDTEGTSLWKFHDTEPGLAFEDGEFVPEDSLHLKKSKNFLAEIINNTSYGHHVISVVYQIDEDIKMLRTSFTKDENTIYIDPESFNATIHELDRLIALKLPIGFTMRSFADTGIDDNDEFEIDSLLQEVRGWNITGKYFEQISADDLITAYCTEHETGRILSPEPHVKYCDTWESKAAV